MTPNRPFAQAGFRTIDGKVWGSGPFHDVSVLPEDFELESEGFIGHDGQYFTREEATKLLQAAQPVQSEQLKFANPENKIKTHNSPLQGGDAIQKSELDSFDRRVRKWLVARKIFRGSSLNKSEGGGTKVPPNFLPGLRSAETYLKSFGDRPEFKAARTLAGRHALPHLFRESLGLYGDPFERALHAHGIEPHEENVNKLRALVHASVNELAKQESESHPDAQTWLMGRKDFGDGSKESMAHRMLHHPDPKLRATALRYPDWERQHPDTPEFKAWFEGSHVTDHQGQPRIAFHGSRADFDSFDPAKLGSATGAPSANLGFFFAGRRNTADSYTNMVLPHEKEAHDALFNEGAKLRQSWFRSHSQDPKRKAAAAEKAKRGSELITQAAQMRQQGGNVMPVYLSFKNPHIHDMKGKGYRDQSYHDIIQHAKANGHDSVIIRNTYDAVLGDALPDDIYVAFHPHQIKSAMTNTGQYDPNNPSITKSEEQPKDGSHYPLAGETTLDGLRVGDKISNKSSIGASVNDYKVHAGVREVPMSEFDADPHSLFYAKDDHDRAHALADTISHSGYVDPIIVGHDAEGPYVLEGAHRLAALHILGKKTIPALVYHDRDGLGKSELQKKADDLSTPSPQPVDNPGSRKSDFVVTHNLTSDNLSHVDELGGLVAPSLAVAHRDHPLQSFGDVVLVAHPDMIDPKNGTPVYDADIYSPRHPRARFDLDPKGYKALHQELKPHLAAIGEHNTGSLSDHIEEGRVDATNGHQPYWSAMARMFLATKGINPPVPIKKKYTRIGDDFLSAPSMQAFKAKYGKDWKPTPRGEYNNVRSLFENDESGGILKEFTDAAHQAAIHADKSLADKTHGDPDAEDLHRDIVAHHIADKDDRGETPGVLKYHSAIQFLEDLKAHGETEPDFNTHREELKAEMQKHPDFKPWFDAKIKSAQGRQYIPDGFTASGNRRRIPYTLDNVLKLMTKKTKGGENFNYGVGSIRAQGAKKFSSLDEIRAHGHRIVGKEEMERVKKEHDEEFGQISDAIRGYHNDPGGFRVLDALSSAMAEAQKRGRSVASELAKDGFSRVPPELISRIQKFLKKLNTSPTEYFEAKPQRVVKLNEFKGAAVPHTTDPAVIESLKRRGLHVELYDKDAEENKTANSTSRAQAVQRIADMQKLHLSERDIVDAINMANQISANWLSKSDLQIPGLMPQKVTALGTGGEYIAQAIQDACNGNFCYDVVLDGKHSAGAKLAFDEQSQRFWLLKPGSGKQSPASGLAETKGTQPEREVAFSKIALDVFQVNCYPQAALLDIDGSQVAAVAMASPTYVAAQDLGDVVVNEYLRVRLDDGDLHKWAIIDYILGNTDSHGHNMLIEPDEKKVLLIDHGGSFAGYDFAPGHDPATFLPYYLRVWNPINFRNASPEEIFAAIPRPQSGLDAELADWLRGISQNKMKQYMDAFGIEDGGAALARLADLQDSPTPGYTVCRLWAGLHSAINKSNLS